MFRVIAGTGCLLLVCSMAFGQAAADAKSRAAPLEFEVASVKPAAPQGNGRIMMGTRGGPGTDDPGRITYNNLSLRDLLTNAYGVKRSQISGGPNWLDSERFDITAKVPQGTTKEQMGVMLQNLLADRFKMVIHRETKEMAMYALVVGKNGPKMREAGSAGSAAPPPPDGGPKGYGDAPPPPPPDEKSAAEAHFRLAGGGCPPVPPSVGNHAQGLMMLMPGAACMVEANQTMPGFTDQLSNQLDRPVLDMTGLKGKYDFQLRFDPSSLGGGRGAMMMMAGPPPHGDMGPGGGPGPGPAMEPQETPPSIFAAVQEQLGLKLEPRRGPADLLVIEHVERTPTEN